MDAQDDYQAGPHHSPVLSGIYVPKAYAARARYSWHGGLAPRYDAPTAQQYLARWLNAAGVCR